MWVNGDPQVDGFEDMDYTTAVIDRVAAAENCNDAFICGISKGGHMTCAYACARPGKIKAAADLDEFMGLTTNVPTAPVPMIFFHGTKDGAVPYAMVKDTVVCSKHLGGDLNLAWPTAEIAVMGADGAVNILFRLDLEKGTPEEQEKLGAQLTDDYRKEFLNLYLAAERGYIDYVVDPVDTRDRLVAGSPSSPRSATTNPCRKHGNIPL